MGGGSFIQNEEKISELHLGLGVVRIKQKQSGIEKQIRKIQKWLTISNILAIYLPAHKAGKHYIPCTADVSLQSTVQKYYGIKDSQIIKCLQYVWKHALACNQITIYCILMIHFTKFEMWVASVSGQ